MRLILLSLLAVAALAGCSKDADSEDQTAASSVTATDPTEFCSTFGDHAVEITGIGVGVEPTELEAAFTKLAPALADLEAEAPTTIKKQVEALTDYLRLYTEILSRYGWSYGEVTAEGSEEENATLRGGGPLEDYEAVVGFVAEHCPDVSIPE